MRPIALFFLGLLLFTGPASAGQQCEKFLIPYARGITAPTNQKLLDAIKHLSDVTTLQPPTICTVDIRRTHLYTVVLDGPRGDGTVIFVNKDIPNEFSPDGLTGFVAIGFAAMALDEQNLPRDQFTADGLAAQWVGKKIIEAEIRDNLKFMSKDTNLSVVQEVTVVNDLRSRVLKLLKLK